MQNRELVRQLQQIERLIQHTDIATLDTELQSHWAKYLCVMVAGFLENALQIIYSDFASQTSSRHISRYVSMGLKRVTNPKAGRFVETAGRFDANWRRRLEEFLEDDPRRRYAIDTIMDNRNKIAHGEDSMITVHQVRQHLPWSVEVVEFIESQCMGGN